MIRNLLIAASAAAVLATASASTASAKIHVNLNVGVPGFAVGEPYPGYPVYDAGYDDGYYGEDCGYQWHSYKKWNKWHTAYIVKHKKIWMCE